jgi:hypothetical protein
MTDEIRKKELQALSGATHRQKLVKWLRAAQIPFINDVDGWPIVTRENYLNAHRAQPRAPVTPNRARLEALQRK